MQAAVHHHQPALASRKGRQHASCNAQAARQGSDAVVPVEVAGRAALTDVAVAAIGLDLAACPPRTLQHQHGNTNPFQLESKRQAGDSGTGDDDAFHEFVQGHSSVMRPPQEAASRLDLRMQQPHVPLKRQTATGCVG